jgi:lactate dehydrogenase-like 2-hydroxyacid dehydrogenase
MTEQPIVLATRRFPEAVLERLRRNYQAKINEADEVFDAERLIAEAEGCAGLLVASTEKFPREVIERLPESVQILATFSVGLDHVDLEAARARSLVVTNTPEVLTDSTADICLLLMLGAARRAWEGQRLVHENRWERWSPTQLLGVQVTGKRLGIFGMGRIGRAVAQRARGFEMEIHYHNRSRLAPDLEDGAIYHDSFESLLKVSDFLSINAPASAETKRSLNAERIPLLPDRAVVVNAARGDMVDDEALIAALKSGKVAAAGLDVFAGEPNINPGYRTLENVFLLPHLGSATVETRNAMGFKCLDNLDAWFAGREPPDRVV